MKVNALILHLVRATGRRENAGHLLKACGLEGEIFPAIDCADLSPTELRRPVGDHIFKPYFPFDLNDGDIGCTLSHRAMWAEIVKRDVDAMLIMEDDAGIEPDTFADALALATKHIEKLGYIQFQTRLRPGPVTEIDTQGQARLIVPEVGGLRTTAQMVSKQAAAHLLDRSEMFDRPVDTLVQSHWFTGLRPAMIYPSGVFENSQAVGGSTIRPNPKPFLYKLKREFVRARYRTAVRRYSRKSPAPMPQAGA